MAGARPPRRVRAEPGPDRPQFEADRSRSFDDIRPIRGLAERFIDPDDVAQEHRPAKRFELGVFAIPSIGLLPGISSKPSRAEPGLGAAAWLSPVGMTP